MFYTGYTLHSSVSLLSHTEGLRALRALLLCTTGHTMLCPTVSVYYIQSVCTGTQKHSLAVYVHYATHSLNFVINVVCAELFPCETAWQLLTDFWKFLIQCLIQQPQASNHFQQNTALEMFKEYYKTDEMKWKKKKCTHTNITHIIQKAAFQKIKSELKSGCLCFLPS